MSHLGYLGQITGRALACYPVLTKTVLVIGKGKILTPTEQTPLIDCQTAVIM